MSVRSEIKGGRRVYIVLMCPYCGITTHDPAVGCAYCKGGGPLRDAPMVPLAGYEPLGPLSDSPMDGGDHHE